MQNDPIKLAEHRLKEKERQQRTRNEEKEAAIKDPRRKVWQTMQESMRKAEYRRRLKEKKAKVVEKNDRNRNNKRRQANRQHLSEKEKIRRQLQKEKAKTKRLQRKLTSSQHSSASTSSLHDYEEETSENPTKLLFKVMSPTSRKRVAHKMMLTDQPAAKRLRKVGVRVTRDRAMAKSLTVMESKVTHFLNECENSMECPDKKKAGTRYRLSDLDTLHEKFCSENTEVEISYSYFCKLVPANIVKPKPHEWGTCLCKYCLNPELKLEAVNNRYTGTAKLEGVRDAVDVKRMIATIQMNSKTDSDMIAYLEWTSEKTKNMTKQGLEKTSYLSKKTLKKLPMTMFLKELEADLSFYIQHLTAMRSQFRRIKEVRSF